MANNSTSSKSIPDAPLRSTVSTNQLRILLEAVEKEPNLYHFRHPDVVSYLISKKWYYLVIELNESANGAHMPVAYWKNVLSYWSRKVHARNMSNIYPEKLKYLSQENRVLFELEKRLKKFLDVEEAKQIVNITYNGKMDRDSSEPGAKFVLHMLDVFPTENDDGQPWARRRCFIIKEKDPFDPTGIAKRYRIIFERIGHVKEEEQVRVERRQSPQSGIASDVIKILFMLEDHIQMFKHVWKRRYGDN